jgi:hypothetical protein
MSEKKHPKKTVEHDGVGTYFHSPEDDLPKPKATRRRGELPEGVSSTMFEDGGNFDAALKRATPDTSGGRTVVTPTGTYFHSPEDDLPKPKATRRRESRDSFFD